MKKILFLGLTLLMMGKAYSQIVYTPVNPNFEIDLSPTGGSAANLFPIDFNNDGAVDFNFRWDVFSAGTYFMHITSSTSYNPNNQVMGLGSFNSYGVPYAMPLNVDTMIGSSSAGWITEPRGPLIGDGESTNFLGLGDRYIGVRFLVAGQYYYGWVLVSFATNKLTIKSYAYQSTPNVAIEAGNKGGSLGVEDRNLTDKVKLYPNPATESVKLSGLKGTSQYKIYNTEGRIIKRGTIDTTNNKIIISEFVNGTYVLSVENRDQKTEMKFMKK